MIQSSAELKTRILNKTHQVQITFTVAFKKNKKTHTQYTKYTKYTKCKIYIVVFVVGTSVD